MTRVTDTDVTEVVETCQKCVELQAELERLHAEITKIKAARVGWQPLNWWCLFAIGILLLALAPLTLPLAIYLIVEWSLDQTWFVLLVQGFIFGLPVAQLSLVAVFGVLHCRPVWQRLSMFAILFAGCGAISLCCLASLEFDESIIVLLFLPLVLVAVALPTFLCRTWRRWTICPPQLEAIPQPSSLASFFLMTAVAGGAAACVQFLPNDALGDSDSRLYVIVVLLVFVAPMCLAAGTLQACLLAITLGRPAKTRADWLKRLAILAAAIAVGPLLIVISTAAIQVNGQYVGLQQRLFLALLAFSIVICIGGFSWLAFLWMRMLGYQLLTRGDEDLVSSTS